MINVTKEQFDSYNTLRDLGVINMLDVRRGSFIANIPEDVYAHIINHYNELQQKYGNN